MAKEKWMQGVAASMRDKGTEGDFGAYCRKKGFGGVCQECINQAAKAGGRSAKMALFAANASGGKYHYPDMAKRRKIAGAMKG